MGQRGPRICTDCLGSATGSARRPSSPCKSVATFFSVLVASIHLVASLAELTNGRCLRDAVIVR